MDGDEEPPEFFSTSHRKGIPAMNPYWRLTSNPYVTPPPPAPPGAPGGAAAGAVGPYTDGRNGAVGTSPLGLQTCSKASAPARVVRGRCGRFGSQSYLRSVGDLDEPFGRLDASPEEKEVAELLESLPPHHLKEDFPESEPCAVCRDVMRCGDLVRRLPCLHVFHASCIARWLCVKATCPLDNSKVLEQLRPRTERTERMERIQAPAPSSPQPRADPVTSPSSSPLYQPSRSPSPATSRGHSPGPGSSPPLGGSGGSEQPLMLAQRLSRWLRKLPEAHRGWIVVVDEALSVWQQRFVQTGRRFPLLSPACISKVAATNGFKYRITPGTKWCGDGGWSHLDFFSVLRSGTNIPADKRVPICISYNHKGWSLWMLLDAAKHVIFVSFTKDLRTLSGAVWASTDPQERSGRMRRPFTPRVMQMAGEHTRWTVQKAQVCGDGFRHSFGFRAMHNDYTSPLALKSELGSKETPLQRFAAGKECETSTEWRVVHKLVLLSRPIDVSTLDDLVHAEYRTCFCFSFCFQAERAMDISLTEQYRQHRSPQASALAVLTWALIFSLYALFLKSVLLRKALPMSEAAKSRGTARVEFAENVASCIVAISTHIYLGPAALMLSLHHQFQGYPAAFSSFLRQPPKESDVLQDLLCGQLGEMFTGNVLYQIIFWFLKWETGIDALLHHIGFFLAGVLILNLAVYPKLASSAMCMEVSSIFLSTHLMFRQIDGKLCALLSDVAAAFFVPWQDDPTQSCGCDVLHGQNPSGLAILG
eukprot:s351_g25.t3